MKGELTERRWRYEEEVACLVIFENPVVVIEKLPGRVIVWSDRSKDHPHTNPPDRLQVVKLILSKRRILRR